MKITIEQLEPGGQEEIIIRCTEVDSELLRLVTAVKNRRSRLTAYSGDGIVKLSPEEIFYFESVDNKVFAYCESRVCEVRLKLYELEEMYERSDFIRVSKAMILNTSKIDRFVPTLNSRLECILINGERVGISRQYLPEFKRRLEL